MTLKPMLSYYGSKWMQASKYPLPVNETIIEPFAGGAGYSLRHYERDVILVEKNPIVAAVWRYLIDASSSDVLGLPLLNTNQSVDDFGLADCEKWLIGFWLNAAVAAPCKRLSAWGRDPRWKESVRFWNKNCRARIASQVDKISHWRIVHGSYEDFRFDDAATWFVDPPYQEKGKYYPEGPSAIDFGHLAQWCRTLNGQVMVCENEGAKWLPFVPFCDSVGTIKNGTRRRSKEVIWQNHSSHCLSAAQGSLL